MIDLSYSLIVDATDDPTFFGFYSPYLEGFSGLEHSIEDGLYHARWGMDEHITLLQTATLTCPPIQSATHRHHQKRPTRWQCILKSVA